eukprot:TRINITY_DN3083_c0_g1_i1.p2 TRINITY_DN3083_c0_g1~~TRINITY_DN3083_c0_g1_i1.p2  ORF type:complete len:1036 (-),score=175.21 TRINITY_DN3083_c0_g1_i1:9-3116(-)
MAPKKKAKKKVATTSGDQAKDQRLVELLFKELNLKRAKYEDESHDPELKAELVRKVEDFVLRCDNLGQHYATPETADAARVFFAAVQNVADESGDFHSYWRSEAERITRMISTLQNLSALEASLGNAEVAERYRRQAALLSGEEAEVNSLGRRKATVVSTEPETLSDKKKLLRQKRRSRILETDVVFSAEAAELQRGDEDFQVAQPGQREAGPSVEVEEQDLQPTVPEKRPRNRDIVHTDDLYEHKKTEPPPTVAKPPPLEVPEVVEVARVDSDDLSPVKPVPSEEPVPPSKVDSPKLSSPVSSLPTRKNRKGGIIATDEAHFEDLAAEGESDDDFNMAKKPAPVDTVVYAPERSVQLVLPPKAEPKPEPEPEPERAPETETKPTAEPEPEKLWSSEEEEEDTVVVSTPAVDKAGAPALVQEVPRVPLTSFALPRRQSISSEEALPSSRSIKRAAPARPRSPSPSEPPVKDASRSPTPSPRSTPPRSLSPPARSEILPSQSEVTATLRIQGAWRIHQARQTAGQLREDREREQRLAYRELNIAVENSKEQVVLQLLRKVKKCEASDIQRWLTTAVTKGNAQIAAKMLQLGAAHSIPNTRTGETPLHVACRNGYLAVVSELLAAGAVVDAVDFTEATPLHVAAASHPAIALLLADHGAAQNTTNQDGETALDIAAARGHRELVEQLLKRGAPRSIKAAEELMRACRVNDAESALAILARGSAAVDHRDQDKCTALHFACQWSQHSVVAEILRYGANPNPINHRHHAPLHFAAASSVACVKLLIEHDANIDITDDQGHTPLHYAILAKRSDTSVALIEAGCSVNATTEGESTPLHYAVANGLETVVTALLDKGAEINSEDSLLNTPLHFACALSIPHIAALLIQRKPDLNKFNLDGQCALLYATSNRLAEICIMLIRGGAAVNCQDRSGNTPLHYATSLRMHAVARALLSRPEIDVNVRNKFQLTALHYAASSDMMDICERLINKEAAVNATDCNNNRPLHFACLQEMPDLAELLLRRGAEIRVWNDEEKNPFEYAT